MRVRIIAFIVGAVFLLSAQPAQAAFNLVANTAVGSADGGSVTTSGINTTGANLLVVAYSYINYCSPTISDSNSNTWTYLTAYSAAQQNLRMAYVANATVGPGHTFTITTAAGCYPAIAVQAWSGAKSSLPQDSENGNGVEATTIQPGSITPSEDGELVISGASVTGAVTVSINLSFTISDQVVESGNNYAIAMASYIQPAAGAINPTWSSDGATRWWAADIASFKVGAGTIRRQLGLLGAGR